MWMGFSGSVGPSGIIASGGSLASLEWAGEGDFEEATTLDALPVALNEATNVVVEDGAWVSEAVMRALVPHVSQSAVRERSRQGEARVVLGLRRARAMCGCGSASTAPRWGALGSQTRTRTAIARPEASLAWAMPTTLWGSCAQGERSSRKQQWSSCSMASRGVRWASGGQCTIVAWRGV